MYKLPCKIYRMYCIWFFVVFGFVLYQRHSSFLPFFQRNGHSIFHSSLSSGPWIPETKLQFLLSLKIAIHCSWKIAISCPWIPETELSSVSENSYILYLKNDLSPLFETELSPVSEKELSPVPESLKPNYLLSLKIAISCPWKRTPPFLET